MYLKAPGRQSVNVNYYFHYYCDFKTVGEKLKKSGKLTWLLVYI